MGQSGVLENEAVLLVVNNEKDIVGYLGIWQAGAVAVPVHATSMREAISALRERTGARFAIVGGKVAQWATDAAPVRRELLGTTIVVFTSGRTGEPKGVIVEHLALCFKLSVLSRLLAFEASDVVVVPLQPTFIFGIWVTLIGLISGSRVILVSKLTAPTAKRLLLSATILSVVPNMLRAIAAQDEIAAPALRKILTSGEPLSPSQPENDAVRK